jgi:hypothetical protein
MKYILIADSDKEKFEKSVNDKITKGYTPLGGVSIAALSEAVPSKKIIYSQALILESDQVMKK